MPVAAILSSTASTAPRRTAIDLKIQLMTIVSERILCQYAGNRPYGAWSRASRELDIDSWQLSRIHARRHECFSLDKLLEITDKLGVRISLIAD